ncbi:MAG: choice-of-anchor M domain-containing protein [Isosphaeraceae bacterium]
MMSHLRFVRQAMAAGIAILAVGFTTAGARADYENVYSAGHADLNISYNSGAGALHLNYEFGTNAVINGVVLGAGGAGEREANTITVLLAANTLGVGAAGLPAPFAGNPLWVLPQTSQAGKPFLGIGAESIDPGLFQNDTLTLTLTGFSQRPAGGEFVLWQNGSEATPFMNSANGLSSADHVDATAGAHDHFNWGFTQEGTYDLNFRATGTLTNGTLLTTNAIYRFQVGTQAVPEPGTFALASVGIISLSLLTLARRARRSEPEASA